MRKLRHLKAGVALKSKYAALKVEMENGSSKKVVMTPDVILAAKAGFGPGTLHFGWY